MFINPGNSNQLVKSVQRDYQAAAEQHRQAQMGQDSRPASVTALRVGITLAGLIALFTTASQYMPV
jgi:hypothetical protein